jgi:putative transposase
VVRWIAALDPLTLVAAREGHDAARSLCSAGGVAPESTGLLEQVQIDHTVIDVIVVDERHRLPLGRAYLTVGIDVSSRAIVGMVVTLEAPSATSVGLCLAHMVSDKRAWLEQLGVQVSWPMSGKPDELYVDNAPEFHSEALRRGCDEHGIRLSYRPLGQPHYGGIVERVIGTMMRQVHELPGTTFSNIAQRGDYDSDANAALTLAELQRWLVLAVATYHGQVHETVSRTPAGVWAENPAPASPITAGNSTAFAVDFLPVIRRTLTRTGFTIDHVQYYSDLLKPLIGRREQLGRFILRRDPRDISRIWVLDPNSNVYLQVGYRTMSRPAISVWEHRAATARLREQGRGEVDEPALFRMVEQMRQITDTAVRSTRKARRDRARRPAPAPGHPRRLSRHPRNLPWGRPTRWSPPGPCHSPRSNNGDSVTTEPLDLSHLHESARPVALLPDEERLRRVRADRWIGYTRATDALRRLEQLLTWPPKQRMPNLLIVGPTNNGKSMLIEKFRRDHPPRQSPDRTSPPISVVVMQMPSEPSVTRFYIALLAAADAPSRPGASTRPHVAELERTASWWLSGMGIQMLVIDELHNLLAGNAPRRREFLNLLRYLGNKLRIPLVGVGTHEAYLAIRSDDQLENRFEPLIFPRWRSDEQARSLLASFAASFPLRHASPITTPEMADYLIDRSEGTIGELAQLLTAAATAAITSGEEAINPTTFRLAEYLGPTERRRTFERALS